MAVIRGMVRMAERKRGCGGKWMDGGGKWNLMVGRCVLSSKHIIYGLHSCELTLS